MIELNKKERERCDNNWDKEIEAIKRKYEKDEVVEEDFEKELINTIQGKYNLEDLSEDEIKGQIQFIFSMRIKQLLEDNNITEKEFAEITGFKTATITRYLKGNNFPRLSNIVVICKKFDVSPAYLLGLAHIPSLSYWNMNQALGLSIQYEEYKPIIEELSLFISRNELEFLNFLKNAKDYVEIKSNITESSTETNEDLKEIKERIQKSIFENLDKIVENRKEMKKIECSNLCEI